MARKKQTYVKGRLPIDGPKATTWAYCSTSFLWKTGARS